MAFNINDWQTATQDNINFAPTLRDNQQVIDVVDTSKVDTILTKGLNVLNDKLGFYDGTQWKSWIGADGTFGFYNDDDTSYLKYDGNTFEFAGTAIFSGTGIEDGTITNDKIANTTITGSKIATATLTADKIAANAITADKIAANTITANEMNITSLSALNANLGTVTAGYLQNAGNTNYINLNATGTQTFLNINNNVNIKADGSGTFARNIVSAPDIVANASGTAKASSWTDFYNSNGSKFMRIAWNRYIIDTGYSVSGNWWEVSSDMFSARATISSGTSYNGGAIAISSAHVRIGDGLYVSGTSTYFRDNRVYIDLIFDKWTGGYFEASTISWKLVRL